MGDCTGRKQNRKKNKRGGGGGGEQHQHSSSSSGSSPEMENLVAVFGDKEILRYLIAAQSDDVATLRGYLEQGMPVDTRCLMFLDTALHKACRTGSTKAACLLLQHGADLTTKTDDGQSALHIAVKNRQPDVMETLLLHGARPDTRAEPSQVTPLMLAASMTNTAIVYQLIQTGSSLNLQDRAGMSALHHCFSYYQDRPEFIAHSVDCARLLVEAGADMHVRDNSLKFPLTRAMEKMNMRAVKYFLAQNADPDSHYLCYHSAQCLSPLAFAVVTRRHQLGSLLWHAGATCRGLWSADESLQHLMAEIDLSAFPFAQPRTLREVSRKSIRDHFRSCAVVGLKFRESVKTLAIPASLKDFILLEDLLRL
ncbi:ankyrin repeat and SOCS box protein 16-like [Babylonia areolata]|uniref:ankyrin repeat and SOCS box protein 16-like n=1 Tax=Babylonia areolata TaxID=304850 RepID=UPI003FCFC726